MTEVAVITGGSRGIGAATASVSRLQHEIPMQRGGRPEEVAATIAWLCSDEASYVTGAIVDVSGGR